MSTVFEKIFEGKIIKALTEVASDIAASAKRNADAQWLPQKVGESISVGDVNNLGNGRYSISINVDLREETGAPMAAAYEFGSGERGPEGKDYPIVAKNAPALAFIWNYPSPLGRKVRPYDEFVVFQKVMHPGVEARPYLQPAINANMKNISKRIGILGKLAYREATPRIVFIKAE